jgi:hypothetical protein
MPKLWKDGLITVAGAACVYCAISFGGDLRRLRSGPPIAVGSRLSIPGESTTPRHRDLIIVGSKACRYSRESIEFDRKILLAAASFGLPVHIISPTPSSARWYSEQLSVPSSSILVHSLASIGIRGTPTVVLRDERGIVQGLWEGILPVSEQSSVLLKIEGRKHILEPPHFEDVVSDTRNGEIKGAFVSPKTFGPVLEIDEDDLHALGANHTVVNLQERTSIDLMPIENEVNIPFPELDVRARIELKPDIPLIVDCSSVDISECDLAALKLVELRFVSVSVLDRGFRGIACGITPA